MRAPLSPLLLASAWVSAAWLAGAGCAAAPKEESQATAKERACTNDASDPLHMASSRPYAGSDPQIESILNQPADPRLAWVNRQMYQSLHALDVELRREQRAAACEHPESSAPTLEAQSGNGAGASGSSPGLGASGGAVAMGGGASGGTGPSGGAGSAAATATNGATAGPMVATPAPSTTPAANSASTTAASGASQNPMTNAAGPGAARATLIRKASLSATGGGGNGATAPKITAGSDNDIVARRLRKAAEQETNPTLRAKLWKEYTDYRQGMAAK
jgi:hypothetical protein